MPKPKTSQLTPDEPAWIGAAYGAGWADYGGEWGGVQYMKDSLGFVRLRNLIKNTSGASKAAGSVMFTLPTGYRPATRLRFSNWGVGASGAAAQQIDVSPDGTVTSPTANVPNTEWVSFSGITFEAEQ